MMIFIVVLNTQVQNIKLRSSILRIKSDAQKQMVDFGFERRFHDLNYCEVGFFYIPWIHYLLEGIITKLCRKPSIYCNSIICFKNN